MKKMMVTIILLYFMIIISLIGCFDNTTEIQKNLITVPINTFGLTLNDLESDYEILYENHEKEPYTVEEGLILQGWDVQEKYEIIFVEEDYNLAQTLAKFESMKKCETLIEIVRNNYNQNFSEITLETIGDESYFGENTTAYSDNTSLYLLCFRIKNVVVILFGSSPSENLFISYAKIIENNINEEIG